MIEPRVAKNISFHITSNNKVDIDISFPSVLIAISFVLVSESNAPSSQSLELRTARVVTLRSLD